MGQEKNAEGPPCLYTSPPLHSRTACAYSFEFAVAAHCPSYSQFQPASSLLQRLEGVTRRWRAAHLSSIAASSRASPPTFRAGSSLQFCVDAERRDVAVLICAVLQQKACPTEEIDEFIPFHGGAAIGINLFQDVHYAGYILALLLRPRLGLARGARVRPARVLRDEARDPGELVQELRMLPHAHNKLTPADDTCAVPIDVLEPTLQCGFVEAATGRWRIPVRDRRRSAVLLKAVDRPLGRGAAADNACGQRVCERCGCPNPRKRVQPAVLFVLRTFWHRDVVARRVGTGLQCPVLFNLHFPVASQRFLHCVQHLQFWPYLPVVQARLVHRVRRRLDVAASNFFAH
mmetsp:Transcript_46893/g.132226  ORF Transcript_46893/g.132226 Transcript_46893/m.132226 type:complete len:346 (+) Transcript_46893:31-1068(+)